MRSLLYNNPIFNKLFLKEVQRQTIAQAEFELNFEDAEARGRMQGREEGILMAKRENASKMLAAGLSTAQIA